MKQAAPDIQGNLSSFERSCDYCGARFRVMATHAGFDPHRVSYACPECGKTYEMEAESRPQVQLLRPRKDGKKDQYQETLF